MDSSILAEKFIVPPFSVLDANSGRWKKRKKEWLSRTGMNSADGRDEELTFNIPTNGDTQSIKNKYDERIGRKSTWAEFAAAHPDIKAATTSIFDPVLSEILVNWFSPVGGMVLDPFAGGVVRGAVSVMCGREYTGCDLSEKQISANEKQWLDISTKMNLDGKPTWIHDDSVNISQHAANADMVFSCPPYHDLEVYSENPNDLSNMDYDSFITAYRKIINESVKCMTDDSFAVFVVGDVRHGKAGNYRNFVGHTIDAFVDAGTVLYNEAILCTAIGSLAVRAGGSFEASRKLGKSHQNILVFCKGDSRRAADKCIGGIVRGLGDERETLDDLFA